MQQIETFTLNEMLSTFRDYGIPCSYEVGAQMILQGKLPFALGVEVEGGKNKFVIFKHGCLKWLEERSKE